MANMPGKPGQQAAAWVQGASVRKPLRWLLVALLIGGTAGGAAHWWSSGMTAQRVSAQAQRDQAVSRADTAAEEKSQLQSFQPRYFELQREGFVGDEQRLAWIEQLQAIRAKRRMAAFEYTFSPRTELALDPALEAGEVKLHASRLTLKLPLMHELDLFHLLSDLRQSVLFIPYGCSMERNDANLDLQSPRVTAECELYLPTVSVPGQERNPEELL